MKPRIALSMIMALALSMFALACSSDPAGVTADDVVSDDEPAQADGIGTSPSDPLISCEAPTGSAVHCKLSEGARFAHVQPCGLWWSPGVSELAVARHDAKPTDPDMAQLALPGGLSCSALIAAAPAVVASQGGAAVVYYVNAPGLVSEKPVRPWTRWCAWPPSCTNPDAACCTATCVGWPDGTTTCTND